MKKIFLVLTLTFISNVLIFSQGFKQDQIYLGVSLGRTFGIGGKINLDYSITDHFSAGIDILKCDFDHFKDPISFELNRYSFNIALHGFTEEDYDLFIKLVMGYNKFKYTASTDELLQDGKNEFPTGFNLGAQLGFRYFLFSPPYEVYKPPICLNLEIGWPMIVGCGIELGFDL
jgi:hypothetical protein